MVTSWRGIGISTSGSINSHCHALYCCYGGSSDRLRIAFKVDIICQYISVNRNIRESSINIVDSIRTIRKNGYGY